jgi:hypothetical protein
VNERLLTAALVALSAVPSTALATSGTAFGESSRVAALGNAVSARPGDAGSILLCPGGLADVSEPELVLSGQVDRLQLWMQRIGEQRQERNRWMGGFGFAVATPLPKPLARLRFGIALDFPAEHALRVAVDERSDTPHSPIYDGRPDRLSALGALGYEILPELKIGAGIVVTPSLSTPTEVSYDADRGDTVEKDVIIRLDRDLEMDVAPFFGLRAVPLDGLSLGAVYRAAAISKAGGSQRTIAGGIVADDPIDYYQFWDPEEWVLGVAGGPFGDVTVSVDATYARWSKFRSGFDREVTPKFRDTLNPRLGVEWSANGWLRARAGYGFEPSPIPEQSESSNYLGADTHVVTIGGGIDFRKLGRMPFVLDAHLRARLGGTQKSEKDVASLPDADPNLPGQQIDNLGYPGFRSSASLYQLGISLTVFIGKEDEP